MRALTDGPLLALLAALATMPAWAAAQPSDAVEPDPETATVLESVQVTGTQPGPALWRVSRGENDPRGHHSLWLIGTVSPLPVYLDWRPEELDERLAEADAVLRSPGISVGTGRGRLHALTLAPSAIGLRNNPDRQTLADVLPPQTYARWEQLKARYLGDNRRVERWRPIFAAEKLHEAAVEANALEFGSPAWARIRAAAEARDLPRVDSVLSITIDDPRDALRDFRRGEMDDLACFEATLDRLESDIGLLRGRATAWATGDIEVLRQLSGADPASACIQSVLGSGVLADRGLGDLEARVRESWVTAAERAIYDHPVTVGALPMSELLREDGLLAALAARGYVITAPDDEDEDDGDWSEVADEGSPAPLGEVSTER